MQAEVLRSLPEPAEIKRALDRNVLERRALRQLLKITTAATKSTANNATDDGGEAGE